MNRQIGPNGICWLWINNPRPGYTWNPITGCYNGCDYCYARRIAERFGNRNAKDIYTDGIKYSNIKEPYPFGFLPTLHPERLDEPSRLKKPSNIFVCSMGELFGDWIPDEWIEQVFEACRKAPQHNYLFLTKDSDKMYESIKKFGQEDNWWFGQTIDMMINLHGYVENAKNTFISYEPLLTPMQYDDNEEYGQFKYSDWLIFGALTKNGRPVDKPYWDWIKDLVTEARNQGIPVFMKSSLKKYIPAEEFTQEYPEELRSKP